MKDVSKKAFKEDVCKIAQGAGLQDSPPLPPEVALNELFTPLFWFSFGTTLYHQKVISTSQGLGGTRLKWERGLMALPKNHPGC